MVRHRGSAARSRRAHRTAVLRSNVRRGADATSFQGREMQRAARSIPGLQQIPRESAHLLRSRRVLLRQHAAVALVRSPRRQGDDLMPNAPAAKLAATRGGRRRRSSSTTVTTAPRGIGERLFRERGDLLSRRSTIRSQAGADGHGGALEDVRRSIHAVPVSGGGLIAGRYGGENLRPAITSTASRRNGRTASRVARKR